MTDTQVGSSGYGSADGASADGVGEAAKEQASQLKDTAVESGKNVAGTAKDEAKNVASEVKSQARSLWDSTRSEVSDQASNQQQKVASGLRSASDDLKGMAGQSSGLASEIVQQVSDRAGSAASWLENRDPGSLFSDVRSYAQRKPGTFIAIAAGAGLLVGRLTRSLISEAKDRSDATSTPATGSITGTSTGLYSGSGTGQSYTASTPAESYPATTGSYTADSTYSSGASDVGGAVSGGTGSADLANLAPTAGTPLYTQLDGDERVGEAGATGAYGDDTDVYGDAIDGSADGTAADAVYGEGLTTDGDEETRR